jgi:uncharacterized protein (TIGR01244 family)
MTLPQVLLVLAVVAVIAILAYRRVVASRMAASAANRRHLVPGVDAGGQVLPTDVAPLKRAGYRTLINMRPDGEAGDQPPSDAIASAAREFGLAYAYVPTPAANITDEIIDDLSQALATAERPVLIYCRSGTRVARAWALAEASRPGGLDRDGIIDAVSKAGFNVDDLLPRIDARLARHNVSTS